MSVMTSEKGKFIIVRDGFKFYRKAVLKTGTEKWACIKKDCRAQFFTGEQISEGSVPEILDFKGTHDHEKVNEKKLQRGKISAQVKRKAVENACERPTKIVHSVLKVESFDKITTGDLSLIKRNAYNARQKSDSVLPKNKFEAHAIVENLELLTARGECILQLNEICENVRESAKVWHIRKS